VDNPVRHAVSKLSTAHFVSVDEHKSRLMSMGEDEKRIFVTGNLSLDNFVAHSGTPLADLQKELGISSPLGIYALVLFHPDPSEKESAARYIENILECLSDKGVFACVGYPNTDPANREIIQVIERFRDKPGVFVYQNLDRNNFISLYKGARFIIGNSSSGVMEAASIPVPAINVGVRQRGRLAGENVVFCDGDKDSIRIALDRVETPGFREMLRSLKNPYGNGDSAKCALEILLAEDFSAMRLKTEDPLGL
jgi:UDP-N-acetylglucosamine 2-epimerase (non-hydrolysing)/GDP/UDP-N,N'-diacetylbacillosamine 2-epimerase (hydrolysing)